LTKWVDSQDIGYLAGPAHFSDYERQSLSLSNHVKRTQRSAALRETARPTVAMTTTHIAVSNTNTTVWLSQCIIIYGQVS